MDGLRAIWNDVEAITKETKIITLLDVFFCIKCFNDWFCIWNLALTSGKYHPFCHPEVGGTMENRCSGASLLNIKECCVGIFIALIYLLFSILSDTMEQCVL